jgi:hypothetical protein
VKTVQTIRQVPDVEIHQGFLEGTEIVVLRQGEDTVSISTDYLREMVEALNWQANYNTFSGAPSNGGFWRSTV